MNLLYCARAKQLAQETHITRVAINTILEFLDGLSKNITLFIYPSDTGGYSIEFSAQNSRQVDVTIEILFDGEIIVLYSYGGKHEFPSIMFRFEKLDEKFWNHFYQNSFSLGVA